MKPIKDLSIVECADKVLSVAFIIHDNKYAQIPDAAWRLEEVSDRLRAIHNQTRWIPVSERMPDEATDGDYSGAVLTREWDGWVTSTHCKLVYPSRHKEWQRITPPEGA